LIYYLLKKDFVRCPPDTTRHNADFLAALQTDQARRPSPSLLPAAIATRRKRSADDAAAAGAKKIMLYTILEEEQPLSSSAADICTYLLANPAFDPKRVLRGRMLFTMRARPITDLSFLPRPRLSTPGGIWRHSEGRVKVPHSLRRAGRHAGLMSARDTRLNVRWRRTRHHLLP